SITSSTNIDNTELLIPTTFKDISIFFENKASITTTIQQKKIIRAKRSLSLNKNMSINNNDSFKNDDISLTKKDSAIFHQQIKRIKKTHNFIMNDNIIEQPKEYFQKKMVDNFIHC
ncbi:unnamed protein product, partial [Adineta steineri]